MAVYFKVHGSQCHYSMYWCCCCIPEIHAFVQISYRRRIYQDKHDRLTKTLTLDYILAEQLQKNYECSNY